MHTPVMLNEVLKYLDLTAHLNTRVKIIDATVGAGGYSREFCKKGAEVLGIEQDSRMLEIAKEIERDCPSFKLIHGNFADLSEIADKEGFAQADGIVYDLGVATQQLTDPVRGLSFSNPEADLDMRLDPENQKVTAKDLLNALNKGALIDLFKSTCEEYESRKLARRIVEARKTKPFEIVRDFLNVTKGVFKTRPGINPSTKAFLALRMAVNSEIANLEKSLKDAIKLLKKGGRILVVSFHSGEDAVVKKQFAEFQQTGLGMVLTKKPLQTTDEEVHQNPRSRSAKLRVFEKN